MHPIIENKSDILGGMSMRDLMRGPSGKTKGDYVETFLASLLVDPQVFLDYDCEDKVEYTIVGTELHGPIFHDYEDEEVSEEVGKWINRTLT